MMEEVRRLGATVYPVEVAGFSAGDQNCVDAAIERLRSFSPEVALSLPNAGYAVLCRTLQGVNIFRDILQIPTILIWDHGVLQFSQLILAPQCPPETPENCIEVLRSGLNHPLYTHYSPDRGHIAIANQLGILDTGLVHSFTHFAFPTYTRGASESSRPECAGSRVAFVGNLYLETSRNLPHRVHPVLAGIETRMQEAKKTQITRSFWDILLAEIEECDDEMRKELGLQPESRFFWRFMHDEIEYIGNTSARLGVLTRIEDGCEFFGNFTEPQMVSTLRDEYGIQVRGTLDCITELPSQYANSDLTVDVINAGYISGTSPKVASCLASGGLILFDHKDDFRDSLGEIADSLMYRSYDELNALIDKYLTDERGRRELARAWRALVLRDLSFAAFCTRILANEPYWRNAS
jgi:hypothetical protein